MEEVSQGEEWETIVQLGHSTTGKIFWNIDGMKPKERLAYFEKNGGLVRRRMSKSPSVKQESSCYEACSRIHWLVENMVGKKTHERTKTAHTEHG